MNAPSKVEKPAKADPRMRIWDAVSKTDPRHTKRVQQRGGFTAIDAQYQLMEATRQFGPVGEGWGYDVGEYQLVGPLIVVPVTLWHGKRDNRFGPILGCAEMLGQRPDRDAPKKAITDAITKGLSQLGFNADVFLGLFDDNKYVERVTREFAEPKVAEVAAKEKDDDWAPTVLKGAIKAMVHAINGCGDLDELLAYLDTEEAKDAVEQCARRAPAWWETGEGMPAEFKPLRYIIEDRKRELEEIETIRNRRTPIDAG